MITLPAMVLATLQALVFYVSPQGNDSWPGTSSQPVQTVHQAQHLLHVARTNTSLPAEIVLLGGDYYLPTISLTSLDSNTNFVGQGKAVLHGDTPLTGWQAAKYDPSAPKFSSTALPNISEVNLSGLLPATVLTTIAASGTVPTLRLLENGVPLTLAQYPNAGTWLQSGASSTGSYLTWSDSEPAKWSSGDTPWVSGYLTTDYSFQSCPVSNFNGSTSCTLGGSIPVGSTSLSRFQFMNVPEELNQAGEWYFDRKTYHLYVWPRSASDLNSISLGSSSGALVNASGATNTQMTNLSFQGGLFDAVDILSCSGFTMQDCSIEGNSASGVYLQGCTGSLISLCSVTNVGGAGIYVNCGTELPPTPANNTVSDCTILNYAQIGRTYCAGIELAGCGNTATHNSVSGSPHAGIILSGPLHTVSYNLVSKVCTETSDAGAIYMDRDPVGKGNLVEGNWVSNVQLQITPNPRTANDVADVYLDDMFTGVTVRGNILQGSADGVIVGGGRDNNVLYNTFYGSSVGLSLDARGTSWAAPNATMGGSWHYEDSEKAALAQSAFAATFPIASDCLINNPLFPVRFHFDYNVLCGVTAPASLTGISTSQYSQTSNVTVGSSATLAQAIAQLPSGYSMIPLPQIGPRS